MFWRSFYCLEFARVGLEGWDCVAGVVTGIGVVVVVPTGGLERLVLGVFVAGVVMVGVERVVLGLLEIGVLGVACGAACGVGLESSGVILTGFAVLGAATVTGFKPSEVLWAVWGVSRASWLPLVEMMSKGCCTDHDLDFKPSASPKVRS